MADIRVVEKTETTIEVEVYDLATNFLFNRDFEWYLDNEWVGASRDVSPSKSSISYTFEDLEPGTYYKVGVEIFRADTDTYMTDLSLTNVMTEKEELPPPDPWSWTSSNGNASRTQTRNAYSALIGGGEISDFSYLVWNDMCEKVNEVADYTYLGWVRDYASLSNTKMSSSDRTLTAKRFNSLSYNVEWLISGGDVRIFLPVSKGDPVLGSSILEVMERLNDFIDDL